MLMRAASSQSNTEADPARRVDTFLALAAIASTG